MNKKNEVTVQFINCPKGGPTFDRAVPAMLIKLCKMNKANKVYVVFEHEE